MGRERIFYLVLSGRTSVSDAKPLVCMSLGVYPYEYMDSMTRFDETQLPSKVSIFFCYVLLSPSLSPSLPCVRRCIDFFPLFLPKTSSSLDSPVLTSLMKTIDMHKRGVHARVCRLLCNFEM